MQKMRKFCTIVSAFVLLFGLLCACGAEQTVSESNAAGEQETWAAAEPEGMVSIHEAAAACRDLELGDYGNLTFSEGLSVQVPKMVYQRDLMVMASFSDEFSDLLMHWWVPDEVWDEQYLTAQEAQMNYYPFGPTYEGADDWYADIWCTGSVWYKGGPGMEIYETYNNAIAPELAAEYPVFCSQEGLKDVYTLLDGEMTVADAVQYGNEFAMEWCALTDYPLTLKVQYVRVYELETGQFLIELIYQSCYEGVAFSNVMPQNDTSLSDSFDESVYRPWGSMHGYLASVNGFCCWGNSDGGLVPCGDTGTCESILSLEAAAQKLSRTLSRYTNYEVQAVELEYQVTYVGNAQTEEEYRAVSKSNGSLISDRETALWCNYVSYELYKTHPVWAFYMDTERDGELICYVDCLTGDVSLIDNR